MACSVEPLATAQGEIHLIGNAPPVVQQLARVAEACSPARLKVRF